MTGFTAFLLEQGIETELPISLNEALGLLEEVVPTFCHGKHGYQLAAVSRGQLGARWELAVKVVDPANRQPISEQPVGFVSVSRTHSRHHGPRDTPAHSPGRYRHRAFRQRGRVLWSLHFPDDQRTC